VPPKQGILVEAVGPEPRLVPVEVLLADERAILPRRQAEARAERPAELTRAAKAAALGDFRQQMSEYSLAIPDVDGTIVRAVTGPSSTTGTRRQQRSPHHPF
jgi:hypothetical protein